MTSQDDSLGMDSLEEEFPEEFGGGNPLLAVLWFYHPLIFLSLSLVVALAAWLTWPKSRTFEKPALMELYKGGRSSVEQLLTPLSPLSELELVHQTMKARNDLELLFNYYVSELDDHPELLNPSLLLAESSRLHATYLPQRRERMAEQAIAAYASALATEKNMERASKDDQYKYIENNYKEEGKPFPSNDELRVRRQRRYDYIKYFQAVMAYSLGRLHLAREAFEQLRKEWEKDELLVQRSGQRMLAPIGESESPKDDYLPRVFELSEEDRIRLHYYLASCYDRMRQQEDAEREYRVFLQQSPRNRERFLALMRLGGLYAERGQKAQLDSLARNLAGNREQSRRIYQLFRDAAEKFNLVVEASAPEDILREAYFRGGMAYLAMAESIIIGRETWWDTSAREAQRLQSVLEAFAGRQLPSRSRALPRALGLMMMEQGVGLPDPLVTPFAGSAGVGLALATRDRKTLRTQRNDLLRMARGFFEGSQGGASGRFNGAARVMIARTLLAENRLEKARQLFRLTMNTHPEFDIQLASRQGIAKSYILAGELDRAKAYLLGGVEHKEFKPLTPDDIIYWPQFAAHLLEAASGAKNTPAQRVWELLPIHVQHSIDTASRSAEVPVDQRQLIIDALNRGLKRRDFYWEKYFADVPLPAEIRSALQNDRDTLSDEHLRRANRIVLEQAFSKWVRHLEKEPVLPPFPPGKELKTDQLLVSQVSILRDLRSLVQAYVRQANENRDSAQSFSSGSTSNMQALSNWRESLENAASVNEFLLENYEGKRGEILMETAGMYEQLAALLAAAPFYQYKRSRRFTAHAARTYMRVVDETPGSQREEEALLRAGKQFYSAGMYELCTDALAIFIRRFSDSDRIGVVYNLQGRSYHNLGMADHARKVFSANARRRTPDGRKSLYYLGALFLEMSQVDAEWADRLGDSTQPLPLTDKNGLPVYETALQVFNEIRRLPGINWESRPWRWSTFALGETWYQIARREEERERAENKTEFPASRTAYRQAQVVLRESLERYRLKAPGSGPAAVGLDPTREPEDYSEVLRGRFVSNYFLAQTQMALGYDDSARGHLQRLIDPTYFPDTLFDQTAPAEAFSVALADVEGPEYSSSMLRQYWRNAFFLLGRNYFDSADRLQAAGKTPEANALFTDAYRIYQKAYDRLSTQDGPAAIYYMAECLNRMGKRREATVKYMLARNAARTLTDEAYDPLNSLSPAFWRKMAEDRLQEMQP